MVTPDGQLVREEGITHERMTDLTPPVIQVWMDDMAATDLALSTMRVRQSALSSFCAWLVKREILAANPVARLGRPPHHTEPPRQIPVPYRAQTKGKVESGVKYFRRNFLPGRTFVDDVDFDEQLRQWMTEIADQRIHGTTHERPIDRFVEEHRHLV